MALHGHHHNKGVCSPKVFRLVLFLISVVLVGYIVSPPLFWHIIGNVGGKASCPPCVCDCSSSDISLSFPVELMNNSLADCGKDDPDMREELRKDIIDLLKEELSLQKDVMQDRVEHTKISILEARKASSHYQREAEKCNTGMETCEEAREKAEAELRAERRKSELWESRAREHGWKDLRRAYI